MEDKTWLIFSFSSCENLKASTTTTIQNTIEETNNRELRHRNESQMERLLERKCFTKKYLLILKLIRGEIQDIYNEIVSSTRLKQ